ncbi:MAG TPA: rRNA maturation RNase YbeY [Bacteroidales bacterium]|nr:rRNA maturation RNase YbeY [Bacteroidales bacterium]HPS16631.1 rRNA maturation RNase YbeY [Bacteroidales bacterium]
MRVSVNYFFEDTAFRLKNKSIISAWVKSIIKSENKKAGMLCFIFCSDSYLHEINIKYLNRDTYTDVIAFDYSENEIVSGDIYISIERIEENAVKMKTTFLNELYRVMAHGTLHLSGYSDKTKSKKLIMTKKEDIHLKTIYQLMK